MAQRITRNCRAATIGIGAGVDCDGQVSVVHDLLGLSTGYLPRHAKRYAGFYNEVLAAVREYVSEVREGAFPGPEHTINVMPESEPSAKPKTAGPKKA